MSIFSAQTVNGHRRPIQVSAAYAAEITKWEANFTEFGPPQRPYDPNILYPTMMYKASRPVSGGAVKFEGQVADTEHDRSRLELLGFTYGGQAAALGALEQLEETMAVAAAERAYSDRKMSDRARAEADAKDERTIKHLGEIPADPLPAKNRVVGTTK